MRTSPDSRRYRRASASLLAIPAMLVACSGTLSVDAARANSEAGSRCPTRALAARDGSPTFFPCQVDVPARWAGGVPPLSFPAGRTRSGFAAIRFMTAPDGRVDAASAIVHESSDREFAGAALAAVRSATVVPARRRGKPVHSIVQWRAVLLSPVPEARDGDATRATITASRRSRCNAVAPLVARGDTAAGWQSAVAAAGAASSWREAYALLADCGPFGGAAAASALRSMRLSIDTARLDAIVRVAFRLRDGLLLRAALELAGDVGADEAPRVHAWRALAALVDPTRNLTSAEFTADDAERVAFPRFCAWRSEITSLPRGSGSPVPAELAGRISALARSQARDPAEPPEVRRAARCVARLAG